MPSADSGAGPGKIVIVADEDIQELIPGYLENRRKDIVKLATAIEENDFALITSLCHQMKGSGSGYGFDGISEIARACEDAAKRSQKEEVVTQVNRLRDYLEKVEVVFPK